MAAASLVARVRQARKYRQRPRLSASLIFALRCEEPSASSLSRRRRSDA